MSILEQYTQTAYELYLDKQLSESEIMELISENIISKELLDSYLQENIIKKTWNHPLGKAAAIGGVVGGGILAHKSILDKFKASKSTSTQFESPSMHDALNNVHFLKNPNSLEKTLHAATTEKVQHLSQTHPVEDLANGGSSFMSQVHSLGLS